MGKGDIMGTVTKEDFKKDLIEKHESLDFYEKEFGLTSVPMVANHLISAQAEYILFLEDIKEKESKKIMETVTRDDFVIDIGKYKIYRCPVCGEQGIRSDFRYCYHCGVALKFKIHEEKGDK